MFYSIILPTYNRKPILKKCIKALQNQKITSQSIKGIELIIINDASTDGTSEYLEKNYSYHPNIKIITNNKNLGRSKTRNIALKYANGDIIIFLDSDIIVTSNFIEAHHQAFLNACKKYKTNKFYTVGPEIHTHNFKNPIQTSSKISPLSDLFVTCNASIPKEFLQKINGFDEDFNLWGYEDIEIGIRLNKLGIKGIKVANAIGYHYHPAFTLSDIDHLKNQQIQKAKMALLFYQKYPTLSIKLLIEYTFFHRLIRSALSLFGLINENTLKPILNYYIKKQKPDTAKKIFTIYLNYFYQIQLKAISYKNIYSIK